MVERQDTIARPPHDFAPTLMRFCGLPRWMRITILPREQHAIQEFAPILCGQQKASIFRGGALWKIIFDFDVVDKSAFADNVVGGVTY